MPPSVALVLFTGLVAYLVRQERDLEERPSGMLWLPTIWLLSVSTKPLGIWFGSEADDSGGSPLDRNFLVLLLIVGTVVLLSRSIDLGSALAGNRALFLLLGYMMLSVIWSDTPSISFKRWVRELLAVVMALIVSSERNPRIAVEVLVRRSLFIMVPYSLMLIKYFPELGVTFHRWSGEFMWIGVTVHKNTLGRLCLIAVLFHAGSIVRYFARNERGRGKRQVQAEALILLLALFLFKGPSGGYAYSATSVGALLVGLAGYILLLRYGKRSTHPPRGALVGLAVALIILGVATPFAGGATIGSFSTVLGRNQDLTGRTDIWAMLIPQFLENPVLGSGIGAFWTEEIGAMTTVNEAHNGYLDVLLQLGVPGLVLTGMFLISGARKLEAALTSDYEWAAHRYAMLLALIAYNITEASIQSLTPQLTATFMFYTVAYGGETEWEREEAAFQTRHPSDGDLATY